MGFPRHSLPSPNITAITLSLSLELSPKLLWKYDRLEYFIAKAFGSPAYKILLNPLMVLCWHPKCRNSANPIVRLKHPCNMESYITHLALHTDQMGDSMFKRFSAMHDDIFFDSYDTIATPPFQYLPPKPLSPNTRTLMKNYAIVRELRTVYCLYWKSIIVNEGFISSQSLVFQEDDALVTMFLEYPTPVHDWTEWKTLAAYSTKFYVSNSGSALNLYRGLTYYPSLIRNKKGPTDAAVIDNDVRKKFLLSEPSWSFCHYCSGLASSNFL